METILNMWISYRNEVLPADAPDVQMTECRRAFYAGAMGVLSAVDAEDDNLLDELMAFNKEVEQGRA